MVVSCWSAKGGSGTTVVAVSLALVLASRGDPGVLLVDLAGDAPAALGLPEPSGPGLSAWAAAGAEVPADALARIEVGVLPGLDLLPRGHGGELVADRLDLLGALLAADHRTVVVDCGTISSGSPALGLAAGATTSLLVTRPCYLALRRAVAAPIRPSAAVLVVEPGRALDRSDVESVLGVPVTAEVAVEPGVARAVDAGLLATRLPRGLQRALRGAA
jgi:MinD-like ATPase involved in chromosome partitioning or flagellar assembly